MIPIEFLIDRLGIVIDVQYNNNNVEINISHPKKNNRGRKVIDLQYLQHQEMLGVFAINERRIEIISHHIYSVLCDMLPQFKNLDIDYTYLNKYKK
jgi:hypothetical protein